MPLKNSPSKKAFKKNVEIEMKSGKPQDQSLAIAYGVKRKARKKMADCGKPEEKGLFDKAADMWNSTAKSGMLGEAAKADAEKRQDEKDKRDYPIKDRNGNNIYYAEGGSVSASNERRPMPDERDNDAKMVSRNSGNKPPHNDDWSDRSTVEQAQRPSKTPLSHPRIIKGSTFNTKLANQELDLQDSASVNEGPQRQPDPEYNEIGAKRQGPSVPALKMKMMAAGGIAAEDEGIEARERADEAHLMSRLDPSMDEGDRDAHSRNEEGPNRQGPQVSDMEDQHNSGRKPYYMGGPAVAEDHPRKQFNMAQDNYDSDEDDNGTIDKHSPSGGMDQPQPEADEEHHASVAAAIMARKRMASGGSVESGSPDMNFAEGGRVPSDEISSHDSIYSDDSSQVDLSRNADEDANEEDQLSFNALTKENYSESEGLAQMDSPMDSNEHGDEIDSDKHDMVSEIRRKMNAKRR